jgi:HAD superfamily hydrolase (TIGR01459 family)
LQILKKVFSIIDFADLLENLIRNSLPLLCSNPDYLVDDDNRLSMCGGTVAQLYEDMGGIVYRYGKPFKPIYDDIKKKMKIKSNSKVIVIGDSLWHDIAGGNLMKYDSLWIKEGIHKPQLNKENEIRGLIKKYKPKFAINKLKL